MDAYIDKVANVRGRVRGREKNAPVLLLGSHYDTVKDAGRFDGILGVLVPIAAVKALLIEVSIHNSPAGLCTRSVCRTQILSICCMHHLLLLVRKRPQFPELLA